PNDPAKDEGEKCACCESADVSPIGHTADLPDPDDGEALDQLEYDPHTERQYRRNADDKVEEDGVHPVRGEEDQISAQNSRDRSRCTEIGYDAARVQYDLRRRRGNSAHNVEQQKHPRAEAVLQVVSEDPQVEEIPKEVHDTAVHEHR